MPEDRSRIRLAKRQGIARHGRLARKGPARFVGFVAAISIACLAVSGVSVAAIAAGALKGQIKTVALGAKEQDAIAGKSITAIPGGANILLVGSDTRAGQTQVSSGVADGSRNDVTILIHLSADHKQMTAVSFPRDLMVDLPACTGTGGATFPAANYQQFNTTLGEGLGCTVATVESMTGLTIPYAAEITFDGVIEMSNAIGGVDVCVASPIDDVDTGLKLSAGTHTLLGGEALQFLRTRHGVGDGSDLARISSQQVYLSSMMRKIVSSGTLGNPVKVFSLANAATKNMTLSESLSSVNTLAELAVAVKNIDLANVIFVQYPTIADPQNSNRVVASPTDAGILNTDLQTDTKFTLGDASTGIASQQESSGPATSTPTPTASAAPTATATSGTGTSGSSSGSSGSSGSKQLPSSITGQAASEQTCSVGNG